MKNIYRRLLQDERPRLSGCFSLYRKSRMCDGRSTIWSNIRGDVSGTAVTNRTALISTKFRLLRFQRIQGVLLWGIRAKSNPASRINDYGVLYRFERPFLYQIRVRGFVNRHKPRCEVAKGWMNASASNDLIPALIAEDMFEREHPQSRRLTHVMPPHALHLQRSRAIGARPGPARSPVRRRR